MPSLNRFNRYFTLDWRLMLVALVLFFIFCKLGFWQLARAKEKKSLLAEYQQFSQQPPQFWHAELGFPKQYQRIFLIGHYLPTFLFLDNQHYQHQFGYHVITPFAVSDDNVLLVDRGWIAGDVTRQRFPQVEIPTTTFNLIGSVYYPPINRWLMGQSFEKKGKNLYLIEQFDPTIVSQILHKSIYPFIIRLDRNVAHGFVRNWLIVAMPPERHNAYAVQWFLLALVVLIFFIVLNIKKIDEIK